AVVNVRFADGALASMTISDATASPWNWEATAREDPQYRPFDADAYFIGGTKGALSLPRLHQFSYDGASNWHKPLQMEIPAVDPALPHKMQLKHFVKVVRREAEPVVTPADNVKTLTLLNAIKEAAETGQLVEL
ncbi:Gfo/Idh/MocA family oxidoreductase, partial [Collinsella aerofaciens]